MISIGYIGLALGLSIGSIFLGLAVRLWRSDRYVADRILPRGRKLTHEEFNKIFKDRK